MEKKGLEESSMENIYDFYVQSNKDNLDDVIIVYNGKEITHKELLKMIDNCTKSLISMNIKENDPIAIWLINTPELIALFLAVCRIGAIPEFIDPRVTSMQICNELITTNPRIFFASTIHQFDKLLDNIVENSNLEKIISVSPAQHFGVLGKLLISAMDSFQEIKKYNDENNRGFLINYIQFQLKAIKKKFERKFYNQIKNNHELVNFINWNKFISLGKQVSIIKDSSNQGGILIKTSGTSKGMKAGYGKLIELTQMNGIALAEQHKKLQNKLNISRGDTVMCFAPFSLAYGCLDATIMPLSMGVKLILIPDFSPDKMAEYVLKFRPNHLLTCPAYIEIFKASPLIKEDTDLSFIKTLVAGGEKYDLPKIKDTNMFLHSHNADIEVTVGYGKNEISSACTYTLKSPEKIMEEYNYLGLGGNYIGEPLPGNIIKIVDDNNNFLPEKTIGRIVVSGPTVMKGYYKNPNLNNQAFFTKDSLLFHDTEDLGYYINGVGFWCKGREDRQMYDSTGKKIDYDVLEAFILGIDEVDNCMAVQSKNGGALALFISLKENFKHQSSIIRDKICTLIYENFNNELSLLPGYVTILEQFPITENAKNCWVELEKIPLDLHDQYDIQRYGKLIKRL